MAVAFDLYTSVVREQMRQPAIVLKKSATASQVYAWQENRQARRLSRRVAILGRLRKGGSQRGAETQNSEGCTRNHVHLRILDLDCFFCQPRHGVMIDLLREVDVFRIQ